MKEHIKVVWLCQFSDEEIESLVKPIHPNKEIAPWIPIAIESVEGYGAFDVHIVSPYQYIDHIVSFELRGIHYHFFPILNCKPLRLFYNRYYNFSVLTNYKREKKIIRQIIDDIKPDLIHLFGAENAYYSSSILQLRRFYPTIVTVQGFISKFTGRKNMLVKSRISVEKEILSKAPIAFYESIVQANDIKKFNPGIELFWHFYGAYKVDVPKANGLKYDLVFFARISKDKGIFDLLDAVKIIKEKYLPSIKLCVIGNAKLEPFKEYCVRLGIQDNVFWAGFQKNRNDVHRLACSSKISVLPTYHDINPGTIIESMLLGIPVVSTPIGTNLEINQKFECIKIVNFGDSEGLAETCYKLLNDELERETLSSHAKTRAKELYAPSNEKLRLCLLSGYKKAIEIFN